MDHVRSSQRQQCAVLKRAIQPVAATFLFAASLHGQTAPPPPPIMMGTAWYPEQWPESRSGRRPRSDAAGRHPYGAGGRVRLEPHGTERGSVRSGLAGSSRHGRREARNLQRRWNSDGGPTRLANATIP